MVMDLLLSSRHVISSTVKYSDVINNKFPVNPFHLRRFHVRFRICRFLASSKKSYYQDFQEYAKPSRLLPTEKLKIIIEEPPDRIISALRSDGSKSLYKVMLCTSSIYGSDLSDQNAGILLCIIDELGDSILERIPAILCEDRIQQVGDYVTPNVRLFQRGSTDEFMFWGPKLGRIQAMWISPDSGSWRLNGARVTVISTYDQHKEETSANGSMYNSVTYNFEVEDMLLGEGSDLTMAELRPCLVTEQFGADSVSVIDRSSAETVLRAEKEITNENSMKEYADLKFSLLLYDSMLILAGTSMTSITGGKNTALAFLTGGIIGFLYLLFLQRSVDTLPAPESSVANEENNLNRLFRIVKGPIAVFLVAFSIAVVATKYDKPEVAAALAPKELLAGMVGFLACKASVLLSAFRPVSINMEDRN
ncbi:uncharacterized protein LOC130817383 isoform X1 [Amaranthus tricolor]|uniref:uncharacterized protein LOC130817383 isoform X1 n=1 Tax=Amaranthus tricolor TaxID=29722 RepID=UPI00258FB738|nr:uncharacterized protein LOC130817383 isoform X1 [Amaranthus tricolor]XP_057539037.1 uncharacterized protein LOC130817383 isoform X1 [Amaranthus tricolor]XP_057539038.1 uncharacterized protein LOC130817383 isoform X1 [Amaranthus tricolor]